jgi:GGDEF domain-containing protein
VTKDPQRRSTARARAIADLPIDALVADADDLAKGWAIALIGNGPMDRLSDIPLGEISSNAPALCSQVLRSLQSDVELDRLTGRGAPSGREQSAQARGLAAMVGAGDAETAVEAVEALRGVLWEALLDELRAPVPRLVADTADRLGYVCSCALAVAVATIEPTQASSREDDDAFAAGSEGGDRDAAHAGAAFADAVIVDERAELELRVVRAPHAEREPAPVPSASIAERPLSWDASPPVPPVVGHVPERSLAWEGSAPARPSGEREEIEIRDERVEEGPAAWIGSIGRRLTCFHEDGRPFAVLLVELLEIDSLRRGGVTSELEGLSEQVQDTIVHELHAAAAGSLTCESPGRYWLLALDTARADADRLAERLTRAVAASVSHRDAPVAIVVGAAICPADGMQAPMLAAHADVGLYAARSAARALSARAGE